MNTSDWKPPKSSFIDKHQKSTSFRKMLAVRFLNSRFKNYGIIGVFTFAIALSALCITSNILLSIFITSGKMTSGSIMARWLGPSIGDIALTKREIFGDIPVDLSMSDSAIAGIRGIIPGENNISYDYATNETTAENNITTVNESGLVAAINGTVSDELNHELDHEQDHEQDHELDHEYSVTGSHEFPVNESESMVTPSHAMNSNLPWWWVDFKVSNQTLLDEIDRYLFRTQKLHLFSTNVTLDNIDNLEVSLPPLIPNMKNPCWLEQIPDNFTYEESLYKCHINYRRIRKSYAFLSMMMHHRFLSRGVKWRMRCFPSFFLIGVAKCGTTDLYEALTQHPDIITSELKEPEYWSRQRYGTNPWLFQTDCPAFKAQATFADYMDTYDNASEAVRRSFYQNIDNQWQSDVIFGDYSTHTMEELFFWDRSQDEPLHITADHIHQFNPQTKFIVIFRDPVERAYSRYKMRFKNRGNVAGTTDDFHDRMVKQVAGTNECLKSYKRRVCVYKENIGKAGDHTILVNGMYIIYLKDWLSVFPLEQFMIIRFEDYIMDRLGHINKITEFLGLNPIPESDREYIRSMPAANAGINIGSGMKNETIELLQNFFSPLNQELVELTGDESFTWGY